MAQQSLCELCSLHDLNPSLHYLCNKGFPKVVSYYWSLEHVLASKGYRSSFTKMSALPKNQGLTHYEVILLNRKLQNNIFLLPFFFFFLSFHDLCDAWPASDELMVLVWNDDYSNITGIFGTICWLTEKKNHWGKINTQFVTLKMKSQKLIQEWVDLNWRSVQSKALYLTAPIVPQR